MMCLKQNKLKSVKKIKKKKKIRAELNETDMKIIERINETKVAYGKKLANLGKLTKGKGEDPNL